MMERPILFSGPMVRAILEGRKTVTRRVMRPQPEPNGSGYSWPCHAVRETLRIPDDSEVVDCQSPYGGVGYHLWVRETFAPMCRIADPSCWCDDDDAVEQNHYYEYRADTDNVRPGDWPARDPLEPDDGPSWKPSIHMPRAASRILLEVVEVGAERLHAITDGAAVLAEGVLTSSRDGFANLWDEINGKRAPWRDNPWVWRVGFRVLEGAPS